MLYMASRQWPDTVAVCATQYFFAEFVCWEKNWLRFFNFIWAYSFHFIGVLYIGWSHWGQKWGDLFLFFLRKSDEHTSQFSGRRKNNINSMKQLAIFDWILMKNPFPMESLRLWENKTLAWSHFAFSSLESWFFIIFIAHTMDYVSSFSSLALCTRFCPLFCRTVVFVISRYDCTLVEHKSN